MSNVFTNGVLLDKFIPDAIIYHHPCPDGTVALWSVINGLKKEGINTDGIKFIQGTYSKDPVVQMNQKNILVVDYSLSNEVIFDLTMKKGNNVLILDHHISAMRDMEKDGYTDPFIDGNISIFEKNRFGLAAHFDMNMSGAGLAWKAYNREDMPRLVSHIQDRDLWKFDLEHSEAMFLYYTSFGAIGDIDLTDKINQWMENDYEQIIKEASSIERYYDYAISEALKHPRFVYIDGVKTGLINVNYIFASKAANEFIKMFNIPTCVAWYDLGDRIGFSIRGDGTVDVSEIAKSYGGGGHHNASGFALIKSSEDISDFLEF